MRSVFVHLVEGTREAVCERLSEFAERTGDEWRFPHSPNTHTLEIGFYDDLETESTPEQLEALKTSLGQMPTLTVYADVSGRIPGDAEARMFVTTLLRQFRGVARDDYSQHCWTLAEIEGGSHAEGHPFFDYEGWYKEKYGCR